MNTTEIECRFLEIDKEDLIEKLQNLGAEDKGETLLEEIIMYDKELVWREQIKFVRIRKQGNEVCVSYKEHNQDTIDGTYEIEFSVEDFAKAQLLFEKVGLVAYRHQQKYRHTFILEGVTIDIDTWPKVPAYVELEGESEQSLKDAAQKIGLDWNNVEFHNAQWVLENKYNIPMSTLRWYTFDKFE